MLPTVICTTLLVEKSPQALPLGAACIASAIKQSKLTQNLCKVKLTAFSMEDDAVRGKSEQETAEYIAQSILQLCKEENAVQIPAIVCFSVFVWNRLILEKAAEQLSSKGIITIAGGPEITAHPEVFTAFDYTVSGEGEIKVPQLVEELLRKPNDKTTPSSDGNHHSKRSEDSCPLTAANIDLATLSSPYLDGTIDPAEYGGALWELARGCPFKCSYCYESKGSKTVRLFPMERIRAELDLFAAKKIPQVFVLDPTYNANKDRALQILKMMAQKTPDTFYYFEARAEFITPELARAFAKLPCAVQIGLQSADEKVLQLVHRPFNKKVFTKNIAILNREGVIFGFDLIFGLPGETLNGFKAGIDFAISLYPNNLELFCLSVLPGTDLFDRASELHLTFEPNPPYHIIHTDLFSKEDISRAASLSASCNLFYNEGRAVPWFNTICHAAKIRPSQFFAQFADFLNARNSGAAGNGPFPNTPVLQHKEIEALQLDFVKKLFTQKHLDRLYNAAKDIICLNGAISRTQDSGKSETLRLTYNAEYIYSEYATDLQFFCQNIKPQPCNVQTFMNGRLADFRIKK
ncbi:MAG: DUF4080 domain-containing protein [Treponema sp.]|nr:DUF4080 domain-containing protein [Treponema sp.]